MISIKNLSKSYVDHSGHQKVFENVSYEFDDKGVYSIVGSSGSGKTTLLNLISGLDSFENGTIEVINQNLSILSVEERSALRKKYFGFGYQFHYLLENLSIYENCLAANFGVDTGNIDKTLKKLGIETVPPIITTAVFIDVRKHIFDGKAMKAGEYVTIEHVLKP